MLYNSRSEYGCNYGCCRTMVRHRRRNWHRTLRTRETRAWRSEAWS